MDEKTKGEIMPKFDDNIFSDFIPRVDAFIDNNDDEEDDDRYSSFIEDDTFFNEESLEDIFNNVSSSLEVEEDEELTEETEQNINEEKIVVTIENITPVVEEIPQPVLTPEISRNWILSLDEVNCRELTEFGQSYRWVRVVKPDNTNDVPSVTDKFNVFCKWPTKSEEWVVLNGLLTERYSIASLDQFSKAVCEYLNLGDNTYSSLKVDYFKSMWIKDLDSPITIFEDEISKMIFGLVTGTTLSELNSVETQLTMIATNSYDGKSKLGLNYALKTKARIGDNIEYLRDYFTLSNYFTRVTHGSKLENVNADITTIMSNVNNDINHLKEMPVGDNFINSLCTVLNKDARNLLLNIWGNMVPGYRNLFYTCIIISIVLDLRFNINSYFRIRTIIDDAIQRRLSCAN